MRKGKESWWAGDVALTLVLAQAIKLPVGIVSVVGHAILVIQLRLECIEHDVHCSYITP
jgi:hypothetical protein